MYLYSFLGTSILATLFFFTFLAPTYTDTIGALSLYCCWEFDLGGFGLQLKPYFWRCHFLLLLILHNHHFFLILLRFLLLFRLFVKIFIIFVVVIRGLLLFVLRLTQRFRLNLYSMVISAAWIIIVVIIVVIICSWLRIYYRRRLSHFLRTSLHLWPWKIKHFCTQDCNRLRYPNRSYCRARRNYTFLFKLLSYNKNTKQKLIKIEQFLFKFIFSSVTKQIFKSAFQDQKGNKKDHQKGPFLLKLLVYYKNLLLFIL